MVDSTLRIPLDSALLADAANTTIVATTPVASASRRAAIETLGARVLNLPALQGRVSLPALFTQLKEEGVDSLLVEGGATLVTSILRQHLADHLVVFIAPKILGSGIEAVGQLDTQSMSEALSFTDHSIEMVGEDAVFRGSIKWPEP